MSTKKRLQRMAQAVSAKKGGAAPVSSPEEWMERFGERFRDGGFSTEEIADRAAAAADAINLYATAKVTLARSFAARNPTGDDRANQLLTDMLLQGLPLISFKPGRDMSRYRRHIAYFSKKSARIRDAYRRIAHTLRDNTENPAVQALLAHNPAKTTSWARSLLNMIWWAQSPDVPGAFYPKGDLVHCRVTNAALPRAAAITAAYTEEGLTTHVHPSTLQDGTVRRDISGVYVVTAAVEWVTLVSGELAWRAHNVRADAIYEDEDEHGWVRNNARGGLASYHGARREWRDNTRASHYQGCIGVELELGFKSTGQQAKFLNRFVDERGRFLNGRPFLVESDSSLGGITGAMEIISEPLPLYEGYQAADAHWRWLLTHLSSMGAEGWKHRDKAGIHVNMDTSGKRPNEVVRFIAFINNAASISRFISGRKRIYGVHDEYPLHAADTELGDIKQFIDADQHAAGGGYTKVTTELLRRFSDDGSSAAFGAALANFRQRGKYQTVHVRQNGVLEVRIFGSNIRYEGFMACVEYCVAGMAFTSALPNDTAALDADIGTQFRTWLAGQVEAYPNLALRLGVEGTTTVAARPLVELVA